MSTPVRARRLTEDEGRYLLRLVRRGVHDSVRYRRALIIMASSSGTRVPVIARLLAADPDTVRDVIHAFMFTMANSNYPNHPPWPGPCTPTCAGATPTTATPTSSRPNAANAPESAARKDSAGAADPRWSRDQAVRRSHD
jgi:hypothetical protein